MSFYVPSFLNLKDDFKILVDPCILNEVLNYKLADKSDVADHRNIGPILCEVESPNDEVKKGKKKKK